MITAEQSRNLQVGDRIAYAYGILPPSTGEVVFLGKGCFVVAWNNHFPNVGSYPYVDEKAFTLLPKEKADAPSNG